MKVDNGVDYVTDALGWVDDFRALPGECGTPLSRKLYAHALISQGVSMNQIKLMGFSKEIILEISNTIIEEAYSESR